MRRSWTVALVAGVSILCAPGGAIAQATWELPPDPEPCPAGPLGPYSARVVDLATRRPIADALVIAAWESAPNAEGEWETLAVRETRTSATGNFTVSVPPGVARITPRPCGPRVLVYKMGYVTLPSEPGLRFGVPIRRVMERGAVIELEPVADGEEWTEAIHMLYATFSSHTGGLRRTRLTQNPFVLSMRVFAESLEFFKADLQRNPGFWGVEDGQLRGGAPTSSTPQASRPGRSPSASLLGDRYLRGPSVPYEGVVLDADTRQPLSGAVVVAVWRRLRMLPLHSQHVFYAARETLTGPDGRFTLDARDIEDTALPRTTQPEFLIFVPGYGAWGSMSPDLGRLVRERGFGDGGNPRGPGFTLGLPRLVTRAEELAAIPGAGPLGIQTSDDRSCGVWLQPRDTVANFIRLVNEARARAGLPDALYDPAWDRGGAKCAARSGG